MSLARELIQATVQPCVNIHSKSGWSTAKKKSIACKECYLKKYTILKATGCPTHTHKTMCAVSLLFTHCLQIHSDESSFNCIPSIQLLIVVNRK